MVSLVCLKKKNIYKWVNEFKNGRITCTDIERPGRPEHPAYSPDLAPSDYFLFGLLKKELKGKAFDLDEDVQKIFFTRFLRVPIKRVFTSCQKDGDDAALDVVVNPPKEGEDSYVLYNREHTEWMASLKKKAEYISKELARIPRLRCFPIMGGIYAFPSILLPLEAMDPEGPTDYTYVQELLENTGVCVVPGSQFGQIPGTYHFRMSILLPLEQLEEAVERLKISNSI
ncbi:GPT2 [Cordylochernes scorpioides]|uniref:alanine transaminase n=1 Tax=Cordylochernes scorpioides TaxID=51811 RepID=A0ABY6LRR0_9ARAC|nr:GPT2 [Cordylochernes scorpioides]